MGLPSRKFTLLFLLLGIVLPCSLSQNTGPVFGMGSSFTRMIYEKAMRVYTALERPEVGMVYEALSSQAGLCRIKDYYTYCNWEVKAEPFTDMAMTEITLTEEERRRWPDLVQVPLLAQAVVMVVNIPEYEVEAPNLRLDRRTTALIFSGNITRWNDPRILAIQFFVVGNFLAGLDEEIKVVVRDDVSGTTQVFKRALNRFSGRVDAAEDSGNVWEGIDSHRLQKKIGGSGVALAVHLTDFSIGYCDMSTAAALGLRVTDFVQDSGHVLSPTPEAVEYAMFEKGVVLEEDNSADLIDARGDNAWPISTYSYVVARTNVKGDRIRQNGDCLHVIQMIDFIEWYLESEFTTEILREFHAVPLGKSTLGAVVEIVDSVFYCGNQWLGHKETTTMLPVHSTGQSEKFASLFEIQFLTYQNLEHTIATFDYFPNASRPLSYPLQDEEGWMVVIGNDIFQEEWFINAQYNEIHELTEGLDTYLATPWFLLPFYVIFHIPGEHYAVQTLMLNFDLLKDLLSRKWKTWDYGLLNKLNPWLADAYFDNNLEFVTTEDPNDFVFQSTRKLIGFEADVEGEEWDLMVHLPSYLHVYQYVETTPGAIAVVPYVQFDMVNSKVAAVGGTKHNPSEEVGVLPSLENLKNCIGPSSYNPVSFEVIEDRSRETNVSKCYPLTLPVYIIQHFSYSHFNMWCKEELSRGSQATAFLRYLFLSGPETEEPIIQEGSLPLMWTAENAAHIRRIQEVMEFMPCGFPHPEPTPVDNTLLFFVILGAGVLSVLVCCCLACNHHHHRQKTLRLNPLYGINIQKVLENLIDEFLEVTEGEVATYIPQLSVVNPDLFGIAVMTTEGKLYHAGDSDQMYSIQSMSKPFLYAQALMENGFEMMHMKVGVEPSGGAFNSEKMDTQGRPFNPYINAGAIACVGLLPFGETDQRYEEVQLFFNSLSYSGELPLCKDTYESESSTADQNRLIGRVLLENTILATEFDMEHGLEAYFMACSTMVSAIDSACMAAVLANKGVHPVSKESLVPKDVVEEVNAVMMTCGMYNGAGNWMIDVGIPAKSGVSGGIMAVVPGVCGLSIYSPRLNQHFNSVRGMLVCAELSERLGLHLINKQSATEASKASAKSTFGFNKSKAGSVKPSERSVGGSSKGKGGSSKGKGKGKVANASSESLDMLDNSRSGSRDSRGSRDSNAWTSPEPKKGNKKANTKVDKKAEGNRRSMLEGMFSKM